MWDGGAKDGSGKTATSDFIRGLAHTIPPTVDMLKHVAGFDATNMLNPAVEPQMKQSDASPGETEVAPAAETVSPESPK